MIDLMAYGRAGKSYFHPQTPDDGRKAVIFFVCRTIIILLQGTLFYSNGMLKDKMLLSRCKTGRYTKIPTY